MSTVRRQLSRIAHEGSVPWLVAFAGAGSFAMAVGLGGF